MFRLALGMLLTVCTTTAQAQQMLPSLDVPTASTPTPAVTVEPAAVATPTITPESSQSGATARQAPAATPSAPEAPISGLSLNDWLSEPCDPVDPVKYPTVIVTGFFQADGIWIAQDEINELVVGEARDTADFRRARLAAKGNVAENVSYMIEFDFAFPGRPSFMDVYLDVADTPFGHVRAGQWRQPFSLDAMTSVRELTFLERALPFAMVPFRQIGIGAYDTMLDERGTWALSGYRFPTDTFGNASGDSGYGMSTRLTTLLLDDAPRNNTLHVGAGYTWNQPSTDLTRIRSAPEVGFNQLDFRNVEFPIPFFVDTGPVLTDTYQVLGAELAGSSGSFLIQSEFICSLIDQIDGPGLFFPGAYTQASYVLTGERRTYNKLQGVYGRVVPKHDYGPGGTGAWELAGRWSYIDLTDANIDGGKLNDLTLGLNWYLNRYAKVQFNYIHAFLKRPVATESDADILAVRAQLDF